MVDPSYWSLKIFWTILLVFLDPRWSKAFEYLENSNYWFNSRSLLNLTDLLLAQWDVCAFYCFSQKTSGYCLWWYRTEAEARGKVSALMFGGCLLGGACCVWRRMMAFLSEKICWSMFIWILLYSNDELSDRGNKKDKIRTKRSRFFWWRTRWTLSLIYYHRRRCRSSRISF